MADEPKRRLLPPGTYRVTHNIVIEGELTLEQLQQLFIPAVGVAVRVESKRETDEPSEEELERRAQLAARAAHLAHAYVEKLGEGPNYLPDTLEQWLKEGWSEADLRSAMDETKGAQRLITKRDKYNYMREVLRIRRREAAGE